MAEDAGQDTAGRRVQEERKVEEREEDRPARAEEQETRAVAHIEGEVIMSKVVPTHEPGGDRELCGCISRGDGNRLANLALAVTRAAKELTSMILKKRMKPNTTVNG